MIILDVDENNGYTQVLLNFLRVYCWEWSCQCSVFRKFRVRFITLIHNNVSRL